MFLFIYSFFIYSAVKRLHLKCFNIYVFFILSNSVDHILTLSIFLYSVQATVVLQGCSDELIVLSVVLSVC